MIDPETLRVALLMLVVAVVAPIDLGIAALMRAANEASRERDD